jgi:uncharacterized protein
VLEGRAPLIVASSDLSHYPAAADAREVDMATLAAVASLDAARVDSVRRSYQSGYVPSLSTCACGAGAMICAMSAARALGAERGAIVSYANSGDAVFGEPARVVGYGAVAFYAAAAGPAGRRAGAAAGAATTPATAVPLAAEIAPPSWAAPATTPAADPAATPATAPAAAAVSRPATASVSAFAQVPALAAGSPSALGTPVTPGPADTLTAAHRDYLLQLARRTVTQYLETGIVPRPRPVAAALRRRQGVFVTFHQRGRLRGCIGHMAEDTPLALATARMALQAALRDPRFQPLTLTELPDVSVELSVLTPFRRVAGPEGFHVGRDGVVLQKSGKRAVYLPQVAPEQGWDRAQTLTHLCRKAGLDGDCWQENAQLFTFQAQVFGETPTH